MEQTIVTIRKNSAEEIRVSLTEFKGHHLVNLRVYAEPYEDKGQGRVPTKRGLACSLALLPQLIDALQMAERAAREAGLWEADTARPQGDPQRRTGANDAE